MVYQGDSTANISFPLGGIGAGSVGLAGNGSLVDWELNNRPNRESINGFTHFAIKAEDRCRMVDGRILQGDIARDFMGGLHSGNHSWGYGHGPNRGTMAGERHFEHTDFYGEFPLARLELSDPCFPGAVTMEAFNPFIPGNADDSSIPAAFFSFHIQNTADVPLKYTIAFSVTNPLRSPGLHSAGAEAPFASIVMHGSSGNRKSLDYGQVVVATDCTESAAQAYWYRGGWFDNLTMFNNEFFTFGSIPGRMYDRPVKGQPDTSTLTASVTVNPGESGGIRFILAWYVPNCVKYWGPKVLHRPRWRNYYACMFQDAGDVANYCLKNWNRLYKETRRFHDALFSSTLPECVLDAVQGNLAILKSSTCLRMEDGTFYGWEGVSRQDGSCEGTCQHVWNYAYALPFLFPELERSVRETELDYNLEKSGRTHFRSTIPFGRRQFFRACVDGQMGTVMKFYREWKISGDSEWLRRYWPQIQSCIAYAWSSRNADRWDPDKTGVIHGRQHHTLDMELFGANSWLTGFYHGALLAGAEMAEAMGDHGSAHEYRALYEKGHRWVEEHLFDGEHYVQEIDLQSDTVLAKYGKSCRNTYWDPVLGQIKYQLGSGCEIDQVTADWHAGLIGLPPVFDPDHRKRALESIYKNNFRSMREVFNPCRVFACDGESGVMMCTWQDGKVKPKIPIPYTEECMTGFEYAVACGMLQCGMEREALEIVSAIRSRYDGKKRNPWAEIECGASYARAMASYSLLLAYSGFCYDLTQGMIGFRPIHPGRYFWSVGTAWGMASWEENGLRVEILYGSLPLKRMAHPLRRVEYVLLGACEVPFAQEGDAVALQVSLSSGDVLFVGESR